MARFRKLKPRYEDIMLKMSELKEKQSFIAKGHNLTAVLRMQKFGFVKPYGDAQMTAILQAYIPTKLGLEYAQHIRNQRAKKGKTNAENAV